MVKNTLLHTAIACMIVSAASIAVADSKTSKTLDWVPLKALTEEQRQALPPGSCGAYIAPLRTDEDANLAPDKAPIRANARQSTLTQSPDGNQQVILIGDVVVTQGYRQVQAQRAEIDKGLGTLHLEGELELREPGLLVLGDATLVNQQEETLVIDNASYVLHEQRLRGTAEEISKTTEDTLYLDTASFTQCEPNNNTWQLKGSQIILNQKSRQGHAKHVRLLVKGIPVLYLPYLRFPIGSARLSGFLAPYYVRHDDGIDVSIPYYFNLAPNYDLLFTTHFLPQHGVAYQADFRHLNRHFETQLNTAYLNDDKGSIDDNDKRRVDNGDITAEEAAPFKGEDRWLINLNQKGGEGKAWSTQIDYTEVSDIDYFEDFDTHTIADDDDTSLKQSILTGYKTHAWAFGLDAIRYQTLSETATISYEQLPAISANGSYSLASSDWSRWQLQLDHEWIQFDHEDADDGTNPILTGNRLRTDYRLGWYAEPEWGFFRPQVQLKHLSYELDDNNFASGADESPTITVPQAIVDTGLFFERDGNGYLQTFEPRLFYFYSDFEDHSKLFNLTTDNQSIDFDTTALTFSYSQLFRDTRFSGGDRIDDANQLALGLTTRFFGNESGREWFSASIGQNNYFNDRRVTLNNAPESNNESAIAAQISSNPTENVRISSNLLYDDTEYEISRGNVEFEYQSDNKHLLGASYRFIRGSIPDNNTEHVDLSLIAPFPWLNDRWHLLLYSEYDIREGRELETLSAIEYNGCCYRIRVGYRSEFDDDLADKLPDNEEYDHSSFFELQLKGLGGTGKQLDSLLDENIDGYAEWRAVYRK